MNLLQKKKFKDKKEDLKKFSFENNFRLVYVSVFLFFLGFCLCVFYGFKTIIPISSFIQVFILIVIASYFVQRIFFRTVFPMKRMEYLMISIFGIGPFLSALFLVLNFYIHIEEKTAIYSVYNIKSVDGYQYFETDNLPCDRYPEFCNVYEDDFHLTEGKLVNITLAKGLFGYKTIGEIQAVD